MVEAVLFLSSFLVTSFVCRHCFYQMVKTAIAYPRLIRSLKGHIVARPVVRWCVEVFALNAVILGVLLLALLAGDSAYIRAGTFVGLVYGALFWPVQTDLWEPYDERFYENFADYIDREAREAYAQAVEAREKEERAPAAARVVRLPAMQAAPAAETDPCAACGGLLLDRPAAFKARAGSKTIAVLGTPARVCGGCGRVFYAPAVEQRLKAIVEAHKADHGQQVFVDWPG